VRRLTPLGLASRTGQYLLPHDAENTCGEAREARPK